MIALKQIYRCAICGNVIEILYAGADALVCCDEPMHLMVENSVDAAKEKHVPVVESKGSGIIVKVGGIPHPMEEKHFITFIEVITKDDVILRKELNPGDTPEAEFPIALQDVVYVREYCNLHGLWKTEL